MFTVIINSPCELHTAVMDWPSINIFRRGHSQFDHMIGEDVNRMIEDGLSAKEAKELSKQYSAILRSNDGELCYFLHEGCKAYVSNQHGKTIAAVK